MSFTHGKPEAQLKCARTDIREVESEQHKNGIHCRNACQAAARAEPRTHLVKPYALSRAYSRPAVLKCTHATLQMPARLGRVLGFCSRRRAHLKHDMLLVLHPGLLYYLTKEGAHYLNRHQPRR